MNIVKGSVKVCTFVMAIAMAIALSATASAGEMKCTDTRDGYKFSYDDEDARRAMHPKYGQLVEAKTADGIIIITESQMEKYYRCVKVSGFKGA